MKGQEDKSGKIFRTAVVFAIIFVVAAFALVRLNQGAEEGDDQRYALAKCLKEKGVKMYGTFWCSHCLKQKKAFGGAEKYLPYVECAVPGNPKAQTKECEDAGIAGYPTWDFGNGTRLSGEQDFETLAEESGCPWGEIQGEEEVSDEVIAPSEPSEDNGDTEAAETMDDDGVSEE